MAALDVKIATLKYAKILGRSAIDRNSFGLGQIGEIAIPEIQRPFVWDSSKVRDLLDSL